MKKKTENKNSELQYKNVIINDDENAEYFLDYLKPFIREIEEEHIEKHIEKEFFEPTVTFGFVTSVIAWNTANVIKITSNDIYEAFEICSEPFFKYKEVIDESFEQIQNLVTYKLFHYNQFLFQIDNFQVTYKNNHIYLDIETREIDEEYLMEQLADIDFDDDSISDEDLRSVIDAIDAFTKENTKPLKKQTKNQTNSKIHKLK